VHQDLTLLTQNQCDLLLTQIKKTFLKLDGIIHCAVETGNLSPIAHYSEGDWSKVIRANLHSPYLLTRALLPLVSHDNPSTVLFSSAQQALKSSAYWGAFAVACQGLKGLMETWSQEIENTNVQMFALDPGKVNTEFLVRLYPGINPNLFPDSDTIAQKYLQLLMHSTTHRELNGKFIQLKDLQFRIV
jgi:NAD(P)-dependent dehydrogenase (short-subunit alcohol dehydrogenase family)